MAGLLLPRFRTTKTQKGPCRTDDAAEIGDGKDLRDETAKCVSIYLW